MTDNAPVRESQRIESLDVLRGFALLGILLLNIIGFAFISSGYVAPSFNYSVTCRYGCLDLG